MNRMFAKGESAHQIIAALSCQVFMDDLPQSKMAIGAIGSGRHGWESDIASLRRIYVVSRGGYAACQLPNRTISHFPL